MNILVASHITNGMEKYFPEDVINRLKKLGEVRVNDTGRPFSKEELVKNIKDVDVCITHWWCPTFDEDVLKNANRLKLIIHAAGSVGSLVTDLVYQKGIKVISANNVMAKFVAEGALAYMLAGLRVISRHDQALKNKKWERYFDESKTLFDQKVGLVGLGTVGLYLLDLMKPFSVQVKIYDPYLNAEVLRAHPNAELSPLEDTLSWGNIISIHASKTQETYHMLNAEMLGRIKDGALLINTARASIIDENALLNELKSGRISAVLDVFDEEPLKEDHPLRGLANVVLMPHMAGAPAREAMAFAMVEEVERYLNGDPLIHEVPYAKYKLMTRKITV